MPRCQGGGRYHVPPWVVPFMLNEDGDALLPHDDGELEGRAALLRPRARRPLGRRHHRRQDLARLRPVRVRQRGPEHPRRHRPLRGPARRRQDRLRRHRRRVREGAVMSDDRHQRPRPRRDVIRVDHFIRGKVVAGRRGAVPVARPRRRVRHARDRPRRARHAACRAAAAARREDRRDHRLPRRVRRSGWCSTRTSTCRRRSSTSSRRTRSPVAWSRTCSDARSTSSPPTACAAASTPTSPTRPRSTAGSSGSTCTAPTGRCARSRRA